MTDVNKTAILMIIDRSGSMGGISDDVVGGFNAFVEEQRKLPGEASLTLVQFDDKYERNYLNMPLSDVPPMVHKPRGLTALYDAIGRGVTELGEHLATVPEDHRPRQVIVVIMTDGHDNRSREWSLAQVKALVEQQREKYNWEFVFTGANIDAFGVGAGLGVVHNASFQATGKGVRKQLQGVSVGVTSYRSGGGYNTAEEIK